MWDIRGPGIKDHKNISKIPVESTLFSSNKKILKKFT
jgi:hypothetical protein